MRQPSSRKPLRRRLAIGTEMPIDLFMELAPDDVSQLAGGELGSWQIEGQ